MQPTDSTKKKSVTCASCDGSGALRCSKCKGIGYDHKDPPDQCRFCRGEGALLCGPCKGTGQILV